MRTLETEWSKRQNERRLTSYQPYPKQAEFHAAGRVHRERLLMAANQVGKTLAAGFELAMHVTGQYPDWWVGRRWDRPIVGWAAGVTGESTRDNPQRILLGRPGAWGTGAVPKQSLVSTSSSRGLADAVDTISVRHMSGELSSIQLKSYEKGREKWQGETLDFVWFDEEPPEDIYTEGLTRTNATGGMTLITFTPLLGMSAVVSRFLLQESPDKSVTRMTIDDAPHFTPEQRQQIIASYHAWELKARTQGIPQLGSGLVFQVDPAEITCDPFPIPSHWPRIAGLDFGWDHPSAGVQCAWDRDSDKFYVLTEHRAREQTPMLFAGAVKPWGAWIPWSWPHDGLQHDKGSGDQLAAQYRAQGLNMLGVRATFEDGTNGVEAGIADMLDRMLTGRFQVFSTCKQWFEEFSLYHRKDGLIVKERDDLISASRYALMMKRHAKVQFEAVHQTGRSFSGQPRNDGLGWMGQ